MDFISFDNPFYATPDNVFIDVDVVLAEGGAAIPYTTCADDVVSGNLYAAIVARGGVAAYVPPVLTPAQQLAALYASGVPVVSASDPSVEGVYAVDLESRTLMLTEVVSLLSLQQFSDGESKITWPDRYGQGHIMDPKMFQNFVAAITKWYVSSRSGSAPPLSLEIP